MSEPTQDPSGTPVSQPEAQHQVTDPNQSVSYDTHRRLLGEKKRASEQLAAAQAKIQEFELAQEESERKLLEEQQRWKELYEQEQSKVKQAQATAAALKEEQLLTQKVRAVLSRLPSPLAHEDFVNLIRVESILVNPESGQIDDTSVQSEVERIVRDTPQILKAPTKAVDNPAAPMPNGSSGGISIDQFAKLSADERTKSLSQVQGMPDWMKGSPGRRLQRG